MNAHVQPIVMGWLVAAGFASGASGQTIPTDAEVPLIDRWTMTAVVAVADAESLVVEAGIDRWTLSTADGTALERLYPTWVTVRTLDGVVRRRDTRLDRAGWMSSGTDTEITIRSTRLARTERGWTLESSHPEASLRLELVAAGGSVDVGPRTVFRRVAVSGTVAGRGGDPASVSGEGRIETSRETVADVAGRTGTDVLTFRTRLGGTFVLVRDRDRRFGRGSRVSGVFAGAKGAVLDLNSLNMSFYPRGATRWTSPETGDDYPLRWWVEIPALGLRCEVEPVRDEQEIDGTSSWGSGLWRGAVRVFGWQGDEPVDARGTLELTGYGDSFPPRALLAEREAS